MDIHLSSDEVKDIIIDHLRKSIHNARIDLNITRSDILLDRTGADISIKIDPLVNDKE